MAQRNNPYYNQIMQGRGSADLVYQPENNSEMIDRYANLLQQRQGEFDTSKARMAEAQGRFGETDTYAPQALEEQVGNFTSGVEKMVQDRYNGDWGAASSEILRSISKERSNPFYNAVTEQNKQVKLQQQAKMKDPNSYFEAYRGEDQPNYNIKSEDALNAYMNGDQNALNFDYGYAEDREEIAGKLISNIKSNSSQDLFSELSKSDQQTLAENGITNTAGLLQSNSWSGVSANRLSKLKDSFVNSLLESDKGLVKQFGKEGAKAEATRIIENKMPQFVYSKSSKNVINLGTGRSKKKEEFGTPPITRTKSNTTSTTERDKLSEYGESDNQTNLNTIEFDPNIDTNVSKSKIEANLVKNKEELTKVEKLLTTTGVHDVNASKMYADRKKKLKAEQVVLENQLNQNAGIGKIKSFENKTGFNFNGLDNNSKAKEIAKIEDAYNSYSNNYLTFQNFYQDENAALKGVSEQLQSENVNINSITDENGDVIKLKNGTLKYDGIFNNKNLEDFKAKGINPYNGKIIAEYKGKQIEYYPNDQAQDFGQDLAEHNSNLKTNGFSITPGYNGQNYLVVKKFNPAARNKTLQNGSYQDVALPIPSEYIDKVRGIKNADDAIEIFDDLSLEYNGTILNDKMMVDLMKEAGDVFEYSTKEELKNN